MPGMSGLTRRRGPIARAPLAHLVDPASFSVPAHDYTRPFWPAENITVDGARLTIRRTPTTGPDGADPALYLHGLGGASTNFTDLAGALAPWFAGEALDLPGHGRSDRAPDGAYGPARFARVVVRHLEQSGCGPVHLVGNSMGGAVALLVARRRPDLVRTLTLISPALPDLHPRRLADPRLPLMMVPGVAPLVRKRLRALPAERRVRQLLGIIYAHPETVPDVRVAASALELLAHEEFAWADEALSRSMKGLVRWWLARGTASPWRVLGSVQVPSLVIWGEVDRLVDVALAPKVARTLPDATLLVLPDVGHCAQMEEPTLTARAILGLRERAAAQGSHKGVAT